MIIYVYLYISHHGSLLVNSFPILGTMVLSLSFFSFIESRCNFVQVYEMQVMENTLPSEELDVVEVTDLDMKADISIYIDWTSSSATSNGDSIPIDDDIKE